MDVEMADATGHAAHTPCTGAQAQTGHTHHRFPSNDEFQITRREIGRLEQELDHIYAELEREHKKQTSRLREEHESWVPLVEDARSRLSIGAPSAAMEELKALEEEENQARSAIRLEFKQRTAALMERQATAETELALQQYFLAPVRKVDEDALLQIFLYHVQAEGSPWVFAHTCTRWRSLVLSSKQLWCGILVTTNIDAELIRRRDGKEVCNSLWRLEHALQRVGNAPIDLSISLNWSHTALDVDSTAAMIVMVAKTSAQWRTLRVENSEMVIEGDYVFPPNLFENGLPNLTKVAFHMQHYDHAKPSRGLVPFSSLIDVIERTSENLCSVHFHGYGHDELTDSYFSAPMKIEDLSLIQVDPRCIRRAHSALMSACPTSHVGWRYAALVGVGDIDSVSVQEGTRGFILPNRRVNIHADIVRGLRETLVDDLRVLDILTTSALTLARPLYLPLVYQLSVYSTGLEDLRFINAPALENFRITLTSREDRHVCASRLALESLWVRRTTPLPVRLSLEGVGVGYESFRKLALNNPRLRHVKLVDVTFYRHGALLGLSEAPLQSLEVNFTEQLDVGRVEKLCADIRNVMIARKEASEKVKLKTVKLVHGIREEVFIPDAI